MRHEDFKEHEKVFEEGDFGDKFYIVLSGRVTVYKGVPTEIGTSIQRRLVDLNQGDSFGELALESNQPRLASVTATQDSILVTLSRDEYQKIISSLSQFKLQEIVSFYKNLPLFHYLS